MLKYELDFAIPVKAAGLIPRERHHRQWQIKGGSTHSLINCWPNTETGFRYQAEAWRPASTGTIADAIALAGPPEKPAAGLAELAPFDMPDEPEEKPLTGFQQLAKEIVAGFDRDLAATIRGARERKVGFIRWCWRRMGLRWLWRKIW